MRLDAPGLLQAILDSPTRHAIIVTNPQGEVRIWNRGAARIFQYTDAEIIGSNARALFAADDIAHGIPDKEMASALRDGCAGDFRWHVRKDGSLFWADGMLYPVRSRAGEQMGFVKILRDATEEKRIGEEYSRLALEDSLTGLPNRAELHRRFIDMAASARRHDRSLLLLLLDLDHFKRVNDRFGHPAGDTLLQQAAHRMRAQLRDTDFVARLGGDEFVILLPDAATPQEAGAIADKLVHALSLGFQVNGREVHVGASIGISAFPDDAQDFDPLFRMADLALYRAKNTGRNRYRFYSAQMDANAHYRTVEHLQLRRALKLRAFRLCYLPQVDATDGRPVGVEALLRCTDPFFASYPIEKVLQLAAETGRMQRLGLWALSEASRQVRKWQLEGSKDLRLTMNFCRAEFDDARFAQRTLALLAHARLAPAHLEIDVAESQLDGDVAFLQLKHLHAHGVSITVDDLGSGGLSLKHVFGLPITSVKLDLRLLPDVATDPRSREVALAIVRLLHVLGLKVVAERIETEAQRAFFAPHCEALQGLLFGHPLSAGQMGDWLRAAALGPKPAPRRVPPVEPRLGADP